MDNRNWIHPFDAEGRRRHYRDIPKTFAELVDDPYRSLAGELRRAGGFAKDTTLYSEFLWADFLRRRVKRQTSTATSIARSKRRCNWPRAAPRLPARMVRAVAGGMTESVTDSEVLIVGAGPTGLTLAVDLGKRGVRCTIIEQKDRPAFLPKMERFNARTMEIFRRIGLPTRSAPPDCRENCPMDVFVVLSLSSRRCSTCPIRRSPQAQADIAAHNDGSRAARALSAHLPVHTGAVTEICRGDLPTVSVRYGCEFVCTPSRGPRGGHVRRRDGTRPHAGSARAISSAATAAPARAQATRHRAQRRGQLLELRQALFRCEEPLRARSPWPARGVTITWPTIGRPSYPAGFDEALHPAFASSTAMPT